MLGDAFTRRGGASGDPSANESKARTGEFPRVTGGEAVGRRDSCVLCGAPARLAKDDGQGHRTCRACEVAWSILEDPRELEREWDRDYYGDPAIVRMHQERQSAMKALAGELLRVCPAPGRPLDVGAGVGTLMKAAWERGWRVEGVEPSQTAANWARRLTGAPIHVGLLERLGLPSQSYDAITVINTVQHVSEPALFLAEVRRLLRPGGTVMIREIHHRVAEACRKLFSRRRGTHPNRPRHAFEYGQRYTPRSLALALDRAGFEAVWAEPSPLFEESPPGSLIGLGNRTKRFLGYCSSLIHRASGRNLIVTPNFLIFGRAGAPPTRPRDK